MILALCIVKETMSRICSNCEAIISFDLTVAFQLAIF